MKVKSLKIRKRESYDSDYPNEIVGIVEIVGETGRMEVRLFPNTVAEIFRLCKSDVERVSKYNANQASDACENAAGSIQLQLESGEMKQAEDSR